jgi:hypothetical protein
MLLNVPSALFSVSLSLALALPHGGALTKAPPCVAPSLRTRPAAHPPTRRRYVLPEQLLAMSDHNELARRIYQQNSIKPEELMEEVMRQARENRREYKNRLTRHQRNVMFAKINKLHQEHGEPPIKYQSGIATTAQRQHSSTNIKTIMAFFERFMKAIEHIPHDVSPFCALLACTLLV